MSSSSLLLYDVWLVSFYEPREDSRHYGKRSAVEGRPIVSGFGGASNLPLRGAYVLSIGHGL